MNETKFLKRIGIHKKDFQLISEAVQEAEKHSDGEIALAIIKQSDDYSIYEIVTAITIGFFAFLICLIYANPIQNFLNTLFWYPAVFYLPAFIGLVIFCSTGLFFLLANIPAIDRLIIPKNIKQKKVEDRMLIHFLKSGVYKTKRNTGILIFISVLERTVIVLGDEGINKKIEQNDWKEICNTIIEGIKNKTAGESIVKGVNQCGEILSKHFPEKKENPDELPNGLVVLEA